MNFFLDVREVDVKKSAELGSIQITRVDVVADAYRQYKPFLLPRNPVSSLK